MKKLFISLAIIAGISLSGCNDSFLEKSPGLLQREPPFFLVIFGDVFISHLKASFPDKPTS